MADLHPPKPPSNGGAAAPGEDPSIHFSVCKRQRRPSVRLGETGDQPTAIPSDPHFRRPKHRKLPTSAPGDQAKLRPYHHPAAHSHPSKTRHLAPGGEDGADILPRLPPLPLLDDGVLLPVGENLDPLGAGVRRASRDPKPWRGARRVRSRWVSKAKEGVEGADYKTGRDENAGHEGFPEGCESPLERNDRRAAVKVRVLESWEAVPAVERDHRPSEMDGGDCNDRDGRGDPARTVGCGRGWRVWGSACMPPRSRYLRCTMRCCHC